MLYAVTVYVDGYDRLDALLKAGKNSNWLPRVDIAEAGPDVQVLNLSGMEVDSPNG